MIAITLVYVMHVVFDVVRVMPILSYYCCCRMPALRLVTASAIAMRMVQVTSVMNVMKIVRLSAAG